MSESDNTLVNAMLRGSGVEFERNNGPMSRKNKSDLIALVAELVGELETYAISRDTDGAYCQICMSDPHKFIDKIRHAPDCVFSKAKS